MNEQSVLPEDKKRSNLELIDKDKNRTIITVDQLKYKCRTCLLRDGVINVFTTQHKEVLFSDLFDLFSLSRMSPYDNLPQKICAVCAKFIMDLHTFKEQVHQSMLTFQYILGHHNNLTILQVVNDSTDNITKISPPTNEFSKIYTNHENIGQSGQEDNESIGSGVVATDFEKEIVHLSTNDIENNNDKKTVLESKTESRISCNICNKKFKTRREYKRHRRNKSEREKRKKRPCPICFQYVITYKMEKHLQVHQMRKQDQNISNIEVINEDEEIESTEDDKNKDDLIEHGYTKQDVIDKDGAIKKYTCQVCKKQFVDKREFVRHKRTEKEERQKIKCPFCEKDVQSFRLDNHINLHLNKRDYVDPIQLTQYTCSCCNTKFLTKIQYLLHKRREERKAQLLDGKKNIGDKISCPFCNKLLNKYNLEIHSCASLKRNIFMCEVCGKTFKYRNSLEIHKLNHADKSILCDLCGKIFRSRIILRQHKIKQHEDKSLYCEVCNKAFALLTDLKTHMRIHTGERPYLCAICGKGFVQATHLKTHTKLIHSKGRPYECPVCNRRFAIKDFLDKHMDFHIYGKSTRTNRGPITCLICDKEVNNARTHSRRHTEEEPKFCEVCKEVVRCPSIHAIKQHVEKKYCCDTCGQSFARMCQLKVHKHCHKESEKHACDVCHKVFKFRYFLRVHQRIHTGERPYKCKICEQTFVQYAHCINHIKVHKGEKNHKCPYCDKRFTFKGNLKQHIMIHTGERPYVCKYCSKGYISNSSLRKHLVVHTAQASTQNGNLNTPQNDSSNEQNILEFDENLLLGTSENIEYLLID